ncbi:MAG: CRISPR-associated protein Cas4, partial [Deltaproteobacteria bacterium]|nr:CRISPR-associated protein Cas4 [Deltaproteobacteria bacterium]
RRSSRTTKNGKTWQPFPVEYKRGRPKAHHADKIQLCAQALCLEEMLDVHVPRGMLFYGKTRRRQEVDFDVGLRRETEEAARRFHDLAASGKTPKAVYTKKCDACSLIDFCLPKTVSRNRPVNQYLLKTLRDDL